MYNFNWFRVEYFRLQFLLSLNQIGSSFWETMLLWFKPTLIVGNDFSLDEQCLHRVGNRHLVYIFNWFRVEYFSVTISALTEPDWVVFLGNHPIMV